MSTISDIALLRVNYLRGPNIWTYRPVLEVWLDLGELEELPSNKLPGFTERLVAMLPGLSEHHCGVGEVGGFLQRLDGGTWAGHILEHVVIELLNLAGMPTGFGQTRSTSQTGVYRMVFRARDEQVARKALTLGHRLLMSVINRAPFDLPPAVAELRQCIDDCYLGPSTACIVTAATDRGIPHIRLNDGNLVQLGHGARQRRIWTAESEFTSAIAEGIASDKDLTKTLLKACGVPVPDGQVADSPEHAWELAQDIGLPVVVKPSNANHGRGVTLDLTRQEDIEAAWRLADPEGREVLVERYIRGEEHRLLVVGNKVVAAARGEVVAVTGNGISTVAELIESQVNTDPRRGIEEEFPLETIQVHKDGAVQLELKRQGLSPEAVPGAGQTVVIQRNGNVAIDCTDEVHAEVAATAVLAARVVGLDIAGIDMVAQDISSPLHEQGGAIVEVNAGPGLLMHLKPAEGVPRPVGQAIADHLFPQTDNGRIPIVGVAGSEHTHTIARLIAWLVHLGGTSVGLACRDGLYLDNRRVDTGNNAVWASGHRLMMNRSILAAVIENGADLVLRDGLAYDRCRVGVVTDLSGAERLGEFDITESDQLVKVLRTQVDVVLSDGTAVLNAADERIADMARLCDGDVTLYAVDGQLPAMVQHRSEGGRTVSWRQGRLMLANGPSESPLALSDTVCAWCDQPEWPTRLAVIMPAVSAALAMDISQDLIAVGIETFAWSATSSQRVVVSAV